jgi:hypothetical protein
MSQPSGDWKRVARTVAIISAPLIAIAGFFVFRSWYPLIPRSIRRTGAEVFLRALLFTYAALWILGVPGTLLLIWALVRNRQRGRKRPALAKGLVLCASMLLCLIFLETSATLWRSWRRRSPALPTQFPAKPADVVRIVVIGSSSALGEPYRPWLSVGQIVTWQLQQQQPNRRFEVEILAKLGASLEDMHLALRGLKTRPDAVIIYSGHNEFVSRFEEERDPYLNEEPGAWPLSMLYRASLRSPFCRLVYATTSKNRLDDAPPLRNRHRLIDPPVCGPSEYAEIRDDFARRLEAIVAYCEQIGALPILISPPSNEGGFEPSRSVVPVGTSLADRERLATRFGAARDSERDPASAASEYRAIVHDFPDFAEAHFRLARMLERLNEWADADRQYTLARDLDGLPIRLTTDFQSIYHQVAARHSCVLIDGPAELKRASPHGVLDDHLIQDAHHPNLNGTILLAAAVLRELNTRRLLGANGRAPAPAPALDPQDCARHFGLDAQKWAAICDRTRVHFERTAGYRFDPTERRRKAEAYAAAAKRLAGGESPEALGLLGPGSTGPANPPNHRASATTAGSTSASIGSDRLR